MEREGDNGSNCSSVHLKQFFKGLEKRLGGLEIETIKTTVLLRSSRILRRVLDIRRNLLSLNLQFKLV